MKSPSHPSFFSPESFQSREGKDLGLYQCLCWAPLTCSGKRSSQLSSFIFPGYLELKQGALGYIHGSSAFSQELTLVPERPSKGPGNEALPGRRDVCPLKV